MTQKIQLTIRTATRDRQASIQAPSDVTVGEILANAREKWSLPDTYEYVIRCERLGSQLPDHMTLAEAQLVENDVLEIQPLADAGKH